MKTDGIHRKIRLYRKLSSSCFVLGTAALIFAFVLKQAEGSLSCSLLFFFFGWGFAMEAKRKKRLSKGNTASAEVEEKRRKAMREYEEKAYERFVKKYGKEDQRIDLNRKRYGGMVDTILVFKKPRHILIDGLDYEWRDILDVNTETDKFDREYTVTVKVKGFDRSFIRLEVGTEREKAEKIRKLIQEIVWYNQIQPEN